MNIQGWFPLGLTSLISLLSKGPSRVFSNTTVWKHQFFGAQPSLSSNSHTFTWLLEKTIALTIWAFFLILKAINASWDGQPRFPLLWGQLRIYWPPISSSVSPSLKQTQLITHIPFLVTLKLKMKNHHAGNCALGEKEVCELLLLNTLKLS